MPERPSRATILGILWIIAGLIAILIGVWVLAPIFIVIGLIEIALGVVCPMAWSWV